MGRGLKKAIRDKTPHRRRLRTTGAAGTSFQKHASVSRSRNGFHPEVFLESIEGAPSSTANKNTKWQDINPRGLTFKTKRRNSVNLQNNLASAMELLSVYEPKPHRRNRHQLSSGPLPPHQLFLNQSNKLLNPKTKTIKKNADEDFGLDLSYSGDEVNTKGINAIEACLGLSLTCEVQQALKEDVNEECLSASRSASPQCMREGYRLTDAADEENHLITPGSPVPELQMESQTPSWMQEEYPLPGTPVSPQYVLGANQIMDAVTEDLLMLTAPVSPGSPLWMQEDHAISSSPASSDSGLWMRQLPATSVNRNLAIHRPSPPTSPSKSPKKRPSNASHYPVTATSATGQKASPPSTSSTPWWFLNSWASSEEGSDELCFSALASPCSPSKRSKERHVGG